MFDGGGNGKQSSRVTNNRAKGRVSIGKIQCEGRERVNG